MIISDSRYAKQKWRLEKEARTNNGSSIGESAKEEKVGTGSRIKYDFNDYWDAKDQQIIKLEAVNNF